MFTELNDNINKYGSNDDNSVLSN